MNAAAYPDAQTARRERAGLLLGLLGVAIFAMTLPMTRLAVGPVEAPQLPPLFVTAGRAAGAGLLSIWYLWLTAARWPQRCDLPALLVAALGSVIGVPLCIGLIFIAAINAVVFVVIIELIFAC